MSTPLPQIVQVNGRPRLLVDGNPFLILGLQWDCDSCFSPEEMNPLFPNAARLGVNTAALPLYWREIEPEPDVYKFEMLDERLEQARQNNMRLVLLWFATWKNASPAYAPQYIKDDPTTYPVALDRAGNPIVSHCPSGQATWERDRQALVAVLEHLRDVDHDRRVILFQIENEPGMLGSDRCYCADCNRKFEAEGWEQQWGKHAAEVFSALTIHDYIDRLAEVAKTVYPIPMYTNVWLASKVGSIPGKDYPSGGAVHHVLEAVLQQVKHLDLIAPDIYKHDYRNFSWLSEVYSANGNPFYVAEHSTSAEARAERNVFYAIGKYGAIGFDPWAIDAPHPDRYGPPLVDVVGGEWAHYAYAFRDSYVAIGRAMRPIVEAQGTDRLFTCVQEPGEMSTGWETETCDLYIDYHVPEGAGRGMIIQQAKNEFLVIGVGFSVRFRTPYPEGNPVAIQSAEWGRYEDDCWIMLHPIRREKLESEGNPINMLEPGVARIILNLKN